MDPVAKANLRSIMYRNDPSGYKTTYGTSYLDVPTYYVSPVYDKMREEREREPYPRDLSPYPNQRFDGTFNDYLAKREDERREMERRERERRDVEERYRREMELRQTERRESPDRRMPRDDSPQRNPYRDPYEEPLSHRSRYDQFENGYQRANGFQEAPLSYRFSHLKISGPNCSKLTTSLVNVSLTFQTLISEIRQYFLLKKCEKLLQCKSFSHFLNKNISVFSYKVVKHLTR